MLLKAALEGPADNQGNILYLNGTRWDDFYWYVGDEKHTLNHENVDEVGDMLWRENVRSVNHRYSYEGRVPYYGEDAAAELTENDHDDLPGAAPDEWLEPYRYSDPGFRPTVAEIVKTVGCFEYQSCEHGEWEGSSAQIFCRELREGVVYKLPGYAEAPWGWDADNVKKRSGLVSV